MYCLPDGYEVNDPSLDVIKYNLNPTYTKKQIAMLDKNTTFSYGLRGEKFLPGFVGLNNIKETDCFNVIIQALARVRPLRDYLMQPENLKIVSCFVSCVFQLTIGTELDTVPSLGLVRF